MYIPVYTNQFSKDVKRMQNRRKNLEKLKIILHSLVAGEQLDPIHHNHKLVGNYQGRHGCHIEADWLLIYKLQGNQIILERTGSHSDLFKK